MVVSPSASGTTIEDTVNNTDPEKAEQLVKRIYLSDEEWNSSLSNPRNWPSSKKWKNALIISVTGFLSTTGSSILVPAFDLIAAEFHQQADKAPVLLTVGVFVLGLGLGPFIFAPMSELYGRQLSYTISMTGFTLFNLASVFAPTLESLIAIRFIAGCFSSSAPSLGGATVSDLFEPKQRGKPLSIYAIISVFIANYLVLTGDWRWTLRFITILTGLNLLSIILFMNETYAPVVRENLEKELNLEVKPKFSISSARELLKLNFSMKPSTRQLIISTFTRPPRLLVNPVCALFIAYYAYIYALIYIFLVSLPLLFSRNESKLLFSYNWPQNTAGLVYIALAGGFLGAAATASQLQDRIYSYLSKKNGDDGQPEYRLVITQAGMIIMPIGLLIWGWSAEYQTNFMAPIIGIVLFAFGLMLAFNSIQAWLIDAFFPYSASAIAAASLIRSIAGGILPLFALDLFKGLGYGKSGTLLAGISLLVLPAPYLLFKYGKELRERFKFEP